jgi:hypothetical protein
MLNFYKKSSVYATQYKKSCSYGDDSQSCGSERIKADGENRQNAKQDCTGKQQQVFHNGSMMIKKRGLSIPVLGVFFLTSVSALALLRLVAHAAEVDARGEHRTQLQVIGGLHYANNYGRFL